MRKNSSVASLRFPRPLCSGIAGRFRPESVADFSGIRSGSEVGLTRPYGNEAVTGPQLVVPEQGRAIWQEPVCGAEAVSGICPRREANRPWDALKGQIYLGRDEFIERHSPEDKELKEIPRAQLKAIKSTLERIFAKDRETAIAQAYREHGYRLQEIAAHLGIHYATVSRELKKIEQRT